MNNKKGVIKRKGSLSVFFESCKKDFMKHKFKYLIVLPIIIYLILFAYKPMYGIVIAFQDYRHTKGIAGSEWVGLENFVRFFKDIYFWRVFRNTFIISILSIIVCFPMPILFALLLNEVKIPWIKRSVQTITYMPHFISMVVICGMISSFCQTDGIINDVIVFFGGERSNLLSQKEYFYPIYVISDIWQGLGWSSIIYLAALSGIDQEQYEAAKIDGASRLQQMRYITLPGLVPTISMLLVLRMGSLMSVGMEKILLLYQPTTYEVAEVISTYVYQRGIMETDFSYSTAVGVFNSVINITMLIFANKFSKKMGQSGLM